MRHASSENWFSSDHIFPEIWNKNEFLVILFLLETFMFDNPAEASTEAINLIDRVNLDMSNENVNILEMGRSLSVVQLYSLFLRFS